MSEVRACMNLFFRDKLTTLEPYPNLEKFPLSSEGYQISD